MNYFLDTEFLEGTQKEKFPIYLFRKNTPPTIDLISIGIVAEDGREYYAISKDFNLEEAWNRFDLDAGSGDQRNKPPRKVYWIRENVLKSIWRELLFKSDDCLGLSNKQTEVYHKLVMQGNYDDMFTFKSLKSLINKFGKTNKEIAKEIRNFVNLENKDDGGQIILGSFIPNKRPSPEFYAYYADYDWVVFCWVFGKMMDLPKGFPMYCKDLKQILDNKQPIQYEKARTAVVVNEAKLQYRIDYPKQDPSKSHNAIEDARWNKQLFDFLNKI